MILREVLDSIDHHIWTSEPEVGQFIAALAKLHKATNVIEVGTFKGYTAACIIDALPDGAKFTSIDIEDHRVGLVPKYFEEKGHTFILKDSFDALDTLPTRSADIIFLDSFHGYERVKGEFKRAERVIKQNGIILMHDYYVSDGVPKWTEEIRKMKWFEMLIFDTTEHRGLVAVRCLHTDYPKDL